MKSIVVMTFYQMMHAIAMAMTFEEKPNLFFCMEFLNPDESLIERIGETGIFNTVTGITRRGEFRSLVKELRKTKEYEDEELDEVVDSLGSSLFDKYLLPMYEEPFSVADKDEEIYVYNDFQWEYYYISKNFKNIVGVEDGYGSLLQQIGIHVFKGDRARLEPFIEKGYYPQPLYRHENVKKIISSVDFEELDDYYRSKLVVWDYKDIVALNEKRFQQALLQIFDIESIGISDNAVLYLGQPLDRSKYCSALDNYLLCRKIITNETAKGYDVYFKPHPAERNDPRIYGGDKTVIMQGGFPVEVFNYQDKKFEKLVTFGSTGASLMTCAKDAAKYFDKTEFDRQDVKDCIKETIEGEKLRIKVFIEIRDCSPETYINAYSCIFRHSKIQTELYFLTDDAESAEKFAEYYNKKHLQERIKEYKDDKKDEKDTLLWHKELGWMKNWVTRYSPVIHFCTVSSFDDMTVFEEVISKSYDYDYMILFDSGNPGFRMTREIQNALKLRIYPAIFFRSHTEVINDKNKVSKLTLKQGYLGSDYSGSMINTVWHRELIRDFSQGEHSKEHFAETIQKYDMHIRKMVGYSLYMSPQYYYDIEDGETYYRGRIEELTERYQDDQEYLIGQIANVVYDYYDWCAVTDTNAFTITLSEAVETLIEDRDKQFDVYKKLADAMHRERALTDTLALSQESNYYQGIKPIVDLAARTGMLRGIDNISRVRDKLHIKGQKKSKKKNR